MRHHPVVPRPLAPLRRDPRFTVAAGLVGLWAAFQNLHRLGSASVAPDELGYQQAGWRFVHGLTDPPLTTAQARANVVNGDNFEHPALAKLAFGIPQRVVGHPSLLTGRALAAAATLLLAALVGWWTARLAGGEDGAWPGRWAGLLAAALVALLPAPVEPLALRIGRYGYLDPLASLGMVATVVLAWAWGRAQGRAAWWWALGLGLAAGLAVGLKENAGLGAVGPVLLVLVAARRRDLAVRVAQAAAAVAVAITAFVVPYLVVDRPLDRLAYLVAFQRAHAERGHPIGYAGRVRDHPDWWANLWFAGHGLGPVLAAFVVAAAVAAVALRRDAAVAWCLAALAVPAAFHLVVARVALPFYWTAWTPAAYVLVALGVAAVVREVRVRAARPLAAGLVAVALLAVPAGSAVAESGRVARLRPEGVMVLARVRADHGLIGTILSTGVYQHLYLQYLPDADVRLGEPSDLSPVDTVVVGATRCRNVWDRRRGRAIVAVNRAAGALREVHRDRLVTVYAVVRPLRQPTDAEVEAQPPVSWRLGC